MSLQGGGEASANTGANSALKTHSNSNWSARQMHLLCFVSATDSKLIRSFAGPSAERAPSSRAHSPLIEPNGSRPTRIIIHRRNNRPQLTFRQHAIPLNCQPPRLLTRDSRSRFSPARIESDRTRQNPIESHRIGRTGVAIAVALINHACGRGRRPFSSMRAGAEERASWL